MKASYFLSLLAISILPTFSSRAIDLKESKFTEIVNDVKIISAADQSVAPAAMDEIFKMPDVLRTGPDSRAELVASDQTVTRVGANTIFSFDPANRTIDLKQGSLLFHSPHGKGGGTIQTGAATASVLGTTIIVSTTPNGGFKVLVLEGHAAVKLSGIIQHLSQGQMIYVLPGGGISPIVTFRLDVETKGSKLVGGFKKPLASLGLINKAIGGQLKEIKKGRAVDTGLLASDTATSSSVDAIPASTIQALVDNENSSPPTPSPVDTALQGNPTINTSTLEINNIFSNFKITIDPNGFLGNGDLLNPFYGFPGRDITINTTGSPLTIDLSAYASDPNYPKFQIVALHNLDVEGSVTVSGLSSANEFDLAAGNQLTIASGKSLEADCGLFWVGGFQPITLDNAALANNIGGLDLVSISPLTLQNGSSISAGGQAYLNGSTISIDDSTITGGTGGTVSTGVSINSDTGSLTIDTGSHITATGYLNATANTSLTLDNATLANNANWGMNLSAANGVLSLNQATLNVDGDGELYGSAGVTIGNSTINPNGADSIDIESGDSITINNGSSITANDVLGVSANSDLTIDNAALVGGLYVTTTLGGNSSVTIENNSSVEGGIVDINSTGGTIDINSGSTLTSDTGSINAEADGDLTVDTSTLNSYGDIDLASDTGNLMLNTATLTGGSYNTATLSGDSSVAIGNNSSVTAGSVNVSSSIGTVVINTSSTVTSDTGDIGVEANSDATVDTATLNSFGDLTLSADNGGLTLNAATLTSGGHAGLNGKTSVNIGNSGITAGDVDVESSSGAITVNNNSSVTANSSDVTKALTMNAHADLTVDNSTLNGANDIDLTSGNNDLSLNNNTVTAVGTANLSGQTSVTVGGGSLSADTVNLQSANGSVTVNNAIVSATGTATLSGQTSVTVGGGTLTANAVSIQSGNGSVTLNAASTIAAHTITLTAGDNILIDNVTMSRGSALTATAANTINVGQTHTVDLSGLASVSMSANTINLYNVNFGLLGIYNFNCAKGAASIGSIVTGDANFINCTLNSISLTPLNIDLSGVASLLAGIHVY